MKMKTEKITSKNNNLIQHTRKLLKDRSYRRECGEFICDGIKMLDEALKWQADITTIILSDNLADNITLGYKIPDTVRIVQVPDSLMSSLSPMKTPQGVLFTCKLPDLKLNSKLKFTGKTYIVLDALQDTGNIGTIWRSASAFDIDGIFLTGNCADPFNWKSVRATMGAVFRLPVFELDYEELKIFSQKSGYPIYGTALRNDTEDIRNLADNPCIIAIGSEGNGLSQQLLEICDKTVKIPMNKGCESLNAAMAATIVMWERFR